MTTRNLRLVAGGAWSVASVAVALFYGCGGDDSVEGPSSNDAGDASSLRDGSGTATDGSSLRDASSSDAADAAPRPHVIFATNEAFTGDLVGAASAIAKDAGVDAGDIDAGAAYRASGNVICQTAADHAGLHGTFVAILTVGTETPLQGFTDADGPWSLVDGTPVASTFADLLAGQWRSQVNLTETGATLGYETDDLVWAEAVTSTCNSWTSGSAAVVGEFGNEDRTSDEAFNDGTTSCDYHNHLLCVQVGAGGAPNRIASVPAGEKIVFLDDADLLPGNFALPDAGLLTAAPPDAGDATHSVADALCNRVAKTNGNSSVFHAWISTSDLSARSYFTSLGMHGPWYRPDGVKIADSVDELVTTGTRSEIEIEIDGGLTNLGLHYAWTGTLLDGGVTPIGTCGDFTNAASGNTVIGGADSFSLSWSTEGFPCSASNLGGLYCFEE